MSAQVKVDHAELAQGLAEDASRSNEQFAATLVGLAQVHATLAVAEQQRLANIIALASLRIGPDQVPPLRHLAIQAVGEYDVQASWRVREGLGLA